MVGFLLPACDSHQYYAEAVQYTAVAREVLVAKGVCSSESDCQRKELVFFEAGGAVYVNVYQCQDRGVAEELASKFRSKHAELKGPKAVLTLYSSKHGEPKVKFKEVIVQ